MITGMFRSKVVSIMEVFSPNKRSMKLLTSSSSHSIKLKTSKPFKGQE